MCEILRRAVKVEFVGFSAAGITLVVDEWSKQRLVITL